MSNKIMELLLMIGFAICFVLIGYLIIRIITSVIRKILKKSKVDEALHAFILNCIRVVLWIVFAITALSYFGIPVSAFLTALGAAGVAVALALKDSLGNFAGEGY